MSETGRIFLDLFLLFGSAKLGGALLRKVGQPSVIGEIIAGMIVGPHLLGLVSESEFHIVFAEMGVVFLLFIVGLETQPTDLFKVGRQAGAVGFLGVVLPFGFALLLMNALGRPTIEGLFVGAALTATSVGITARVLSDLGRLGTRVARIIIGAAVLDDILGMLVLAVVSGLAAGMLSAFQIQLLAAEAVAFVVLSVLLGRYAIRHLSPRIGSQSSGSSRGPLFTIAICICFGLAAVADKIGLAAIIGAFFAGIIFAEIPQAPALRRNMEPLHELLVPIFFVLMGAHVDVPRLLTAEVLPVGLLITLVAIVGKVVGCGVAAFRLGWRDALAVGVGMTPRGEVGIVVALIGLRSGVVSSDVYSQVILMSVLTSLFAPSLLRKLLGAPVESSDPPAEEPGEHHPQETA